MYHKPINSFACRHRPLSVSQKQLFDNLWPIYTIDYLGDYLGKKKLFKRNAPIWLEIGFGRGDCLLDQAINYPAIDFIGVEVYLPGICALLKNINNKNINNIKNIKLSRQPIATVLADLADNSLTGVQILFPDPWPKKRHHKRRLIQLDFIIKLSKKLKSSGYIYFISDNIDYIFNINSIFDQLINNNIYRKIDKPVIIQQADFPHKKIKTVFEQKAERQNHCITELYYQKI